MSNLSDLLPAGGSGKTVDLVASGALANGDKVILKSDGTVEVVQRNIPTTVPPSVGSATEFTTNNCSFFGVTFDSNSNKVVIAFKDHGNSSYGTAIVGTVSDTTISFGSPTVFNSGVSQFISAVFDTNSNKVVIAYQDYSNSGRGTAIVGTVSGTSISFGSEAVFGGSGQKSYNGMAFDSNSNKVVIAYRDGTTFPPNYSTFYGRAIVGTVSGTSISFGSEATFDTATGYEAKIAFDSNSNKMVISYDQNPSNNYGRAIVGTVSGTSISFGTEVTYSSASSQFTWPAFDSNSNKMVITYRDNGNSSRGTCIVGTVSGTNISFGSPSTFETGITGRLYPTFDSNSNQLVIIYKDEGNSFKGTVVIGTVSGTTISFGTSFTFTTTAIDHAASVFDSNSNRIAIAHDDYTNYIKGYGAIFRNSYSYMDTTLTSTNFIGTSEGVAADTATATVMLRGGITTTQSGLTTGSKYYVQGDGTLSTTPDSPSVTAGKALSATTLLIGGSS